VEGFAGPVIAAASKTLPLGSVVRVTNLENERSIDVKANDRGPRAPSRNLDLSPAAAQKLDCRTVEWLA
jgi:rare lipoprotein A